MINKKGLIHLPKGETIIPIKESALIPRKGEIIIPPLTSIDFKKVFDNYVLNDQWTRERKITEFYPSDLTFLCKRNIYYKYTHPEIKDIPDALRIFKIGTLIHEYIQKIFGEEREEFEVINIEAPVRRYYIVDGKRIQLRGRADVILMANDELFVVELKSMRPQYFYDYRKKSMVRDQPFRWMKGVKDDHKMQIQWYMKNLRINWGYVIYYEKVGLQEKIYEIDLDDYDPTNDVSSIAKVIYRALRDGKIPKPERKHWGGKICNYCKYHNVCKEDEEN